MQETYKFPRPPTKRNAEVSPNDAEMKGPREVAEPPELKVTFEREESLEALASRNAQKVEADAPTAREPSEIASESLGSSSGPEISQNPDEIKERDISTADEAVIEANEPAVSSSDLITTFDSPRPRDMLTTPLLAIGFAVALLAAGWSYTSLEATRAELASITQSKASVDRQLGDAQARLSAAEKAVADVKAALNSTPSAAKPAEAATKIAP